MSREVFQEEVCHLLRRLLSYEIQISSVKHPCLHSLRFLLRVTLVGPAFSDRSQVLAFVSKVTNSTTCTVTLPFGFKKPLILEHAIMGLEVSFFAIFLWVILIGVPTSTERFTDAQLPNHFLYSVTLDTKGLVISHLCTRPFARRKQHLTVAIHFTNTFR